MRTAILSTALLAAFLGNALSHCRAADAAEPKYTIKQVMKLAHKDGLMKKVAGGQGNKQDAEQLLALYQALGENKPPQGDLADWKVRTDALIAAAKDVVNDKPDAGPKLLKTANCAECHKTHKPS